MPVSVPVNPGPYGDPGSMLHASPQMVGGHSSVSPRPSSSSGMLDVGGSNNGYGSSQPASSPIPESPTPPPPSALRSSSSMANRSHSPQQHLTGSQRHNLRLAIPGNQAGLAISSHDRGNSLLSIFYVDGIAWSCCPMALIFHWSSLCDAREGDWKSTVCHVDFWVPNQWGNVFFIFIFLVRVELHRWRG